MAALTTADCNAINTAIVRETGRIGPEIYTRVVLSDGWIGLTPSDVWPDERGLVQTNLTFERMLPADDHDVVRGASFRSAHGDTHARAAGVFQ